MLLHPYTQRLFGIFPYCDSEAGIKYNDCRLQLSTTCPLVQSPLRVKEQRMITTARVLIRGILELVKKCELARSLIYTYLLNFQTEILFVRGQRGK